jgi:hypothetical protein
LGVLEAEIGPLRWYYELALNLKEGNCEAFGLSRRLLSGLMIQRTMETAKAGKGEIVGCNIEDVISKYE